MHALATVTNPEWYLGPEALKYESLESDAGESHLQAVDSKQT